MVRRVAEEDGGAARPAHVQVGVVLPGEAETAVDVEALGGDPELPLLASIAKAYCSEIYTEVATENIQLHGGIGFTWEHDAHLYYRRAKSTEQFLGSPSEHRDLLAQRLLAGEGSHSNLSRQD